MIVAAATLRSHLPGNVLGEHTPLCGLTDDDVTSPTEMAARAAYEAAALGPENLDVVELQDTESGRELQSYEELLLCGRGECGKWIADGHTERGGKLPVNVSGGLLSKGSVRRRSVRSSSSTGNCVARPGRGRSRRHGWRSLTPSDAAPMPR